MDGLDVAILTILGAGTLAVLFFPRVERFCAAHGFPAPWHWPTGNAALNGLIQSALLAGMLWGLDQIYLAVFKLAG